MSLSTSIGRAATQIDTLMWWGTSRTRVTTCHTSKLCRETLAMLQRSGQSTAAGKCCELWQCHRHLAALNRWLRSHREHATRLPALPQSLPSPRGTTQSTNGKYRKAMSSVSFLSVRALQAFSFFIRYPVALFLLLLLHLWISLCLCLNLCLSLSLSFFLSFFLSIFLSLCFLFFVFPYACIYQSINQSIYLSIYLSDYPSDYPSDYLSIYLSTCLSVCLSVWLSTWLLYLVLPLLPGFQDGKESGTNPGVQRVLKQFVCGKKKEKGWDCALSYCTGLFGNFRVT